MNKTLKSKIPKNTLQKLVSVIVRTKNRPETLHYALQSISQQTYPNIEIILINEGEALASDPSHLLNIKNIHLKWIENETSKGRCKAGNQGLLACHGDYIIFLDDDDWFQPEHIYSLVTALENNPDYLAAYTGVVFTDSPKDSPLHIFNSSYDAVFLMLENTIPIHALLFSRSLLDKGCQLDETLSVLEDWDLWLQFSQYTSFFHIDKISAGYRNSGDSHVGWGMDELQIKEHRLKLMTKWQKIWTIEQLDQGLHWGQKVRQETLQQCQQLEKTHKKITTIILPRLQRIFITSQHALRRNEHNYSQLDYQKQKINYKKQQLESKNNSLQQELDAILNSPFWRFSLLPRRSLGWFRRKKQGLKTQIRHYLLHKTSSTSPFNPVPKEIKNPPTLCSSCNSKVGIMFHVYYPDLFSHICQYLNHIPINYQLLISVTSEKDRLQVESKQHLLNQYAHIIIKQVENKGQDIAPLVVAFREEIQALDIIAHIHTKKSYYTGNNNFGQQWLDYLLSQLLGKPDDICQILSTLSDDPDNIDNGNIGIIYPETYSGLPYWAHTWLSNRSLGEQLLNRMGHHSQDYSQYIDYPAGSMFWAKTKALQPLLDLRLTIDDFPEELGQTDNTLHHAIERCLALSSQIAGYKPLLISPKEYSFALQSQSNFVFYQYISMSPFERVFGSSQTADVVSFDIFDTLFIRPFASPDAVFWWLEEKIEKQFNITDFMQKRKSAESLLRENLSTGKDVSISEIYQQMEQTYHIEHDIAQQIKQLEITTEQNLLQPRPAISDVAQALKQQGKHLILVSDMYLETEHLQALIDRYLPNIFSNLYVSSDMGQRKDRGDIWPTLLANEKVTKERLLHVGDNEHSDIQIPVDSGFHIPVHVMRPIALLGCMKGGQEIINVFRQQQSWQNELMLGLIANKVLHYYESKHPDKATVFSQAHEFGYCMMGPIFFSFMVWLLKKSINDNTKQLLFLSRDGWLLEQLYNSIKSHPKINSSHLPQGKYFYCSRSFIGLASIESEEDFALLLTPHYKGTLKKLLQSRFGLQDLDSFIDLFGPDVLDREVCLPHDRDEIEQYLSMIYPALQQQASTDKQLFLDYWQQDEHSAIVDIGYSGTLQKAMMKLAKQPLNGYYFVTNESAAQIINQGGQCSACFGHLLPYDNMNNLTIHRYSLLLEAIMTSPEGQLKSFSQAQQTIIPEFKEIGTSQIHFETIDKIHQGIIEYSKDMLDILGNEIFELDINKHQVTELMPLVINQRIDIGKLRHSLSVEDEFSGNQEIDIVDFYAQQSDL